MKLDELLSEDRVAAILTWRSAHDDELAEARVAVDQANLLRERVRERLFLASDEDTVAERRAEAETAEETQMADDAWIAAKLRYEKLRATHDRGSMMVDVWRTISANLRRGNI